MQFFPAGNGSGSRRRGSRNNLRFCPPIPFLHACFPPFPHILTMTPGGAQMFTIPAAEFRHLPPAAKKISSLCETSKKFVYQVLTKRRRRSIIGRVVIETVSGTVSGRRNEAPPDHAACGETYAVPRTE